MIEQNNIERVRLFGFDFVSDHNYDQILNEISRGIRCEENQLPLMITPNVDQIVKFNRSKNARLYETLKQAYFALPDGQPIVTLSKFKKTSKLKSRLTGSDFFPLLWKQISSNSEPVALILPREEIADVLKKENAGAHVYVPPFFDVNDEIELSSIVEASFELIQSSKAKHLIIGLGFPKQELLFLEIYERCIQENVEMPFTYLLGASMEFYTGAKTRAPKIYQKLGMEFLHRLFSEPRRMARRYLIDDIGFVPLAWRELTNRNPG